MDGWIDINFVLNWIKEFLLHCCMLFVSIFNPTKAISKVNKLLNKSLHYFSYSVHSGNVKQCILFFLVRVEHKCFSSQKLFNPFKSTYGSYNYMVMVCTSAYITLKSLYCVIYYLLQQSSGLKCNFVGTRYRRTSRE